VPFRDQHYEAIIDFLCTIQGDSVSSDNIALKFNDVCISNTCNVDSFVTTNIPSSINECKVCLTHNECVCFEDNNSVDVELFSNNSVSMACNLDSPILTCLQ
jgi:hypothetical protein